MSEPEPLIYSIQSVLGEPGRSRVRDGTSLTATPAAPASRFRRDSARIARTPVRKNGRPDYPRHFLAGEWGGVSGIWHITDRLPTTPVERRRVSGVPKPPEQRTGVGWVRRD